MLICDMQWTRPSLDYERDRPTRLTPPSDRFVVARI
jgi:hypothetical protein